jgi:hypothetical protein
MPPTLIIIPYIELLALIVRASKDTFNSDFRAVPHEAQLGPLSSQKNEKSHGFNYLIASCIDGPYIK